MKQKQQTVLRHMRVEQQRVISTMEDIFINVWKYFIFTTVWTAIANGAN